MVDKTEEIVPEEEVVEKRPIRQSQSTLVLVEELTNHIPNKYEAVRAIAMEALNINSMYLMHGVVDIGDKPTTKAIKRALAGKLSFDYGEEEPPPPPQKAESDEEEDTSES